MIPFTRCLCPEDVGGLIDLTVLGDRNTGSMADMQLQGVAALYNILCERSFAYLADEVGMGKTYQALGLAAVLWNEKPNARVLFISPRQNLQTKWIDDYHRFFSSNYRRQQGVGDDRVTSVLFNEPIHRPVLYHNLRSWTPTIGVPERIAPFIRHTSFTRPLYVTANDFCDMDALWENTLAKLRSWGLFKVTRPRNLSPDNASFKLNMAFSQALNAKLCFEAEGKSFFDLVIVDEAQCLRNPTNQTNQVLFGVLNNHVQKWLFMSATPAHGGPADLPKILNHYPDCGKVLTEDLVDDLTAMQQELQPFLVRRQRKYRTMPNHDPVGKDLYRNHDDKGWGIRDADMSTLGTLAISLVQKGLVDVLQGRSNKYRIGFLSSFESLQSSISRTLDPLTDDTDIAEDKTSGDWHRNQTDSPLENEAPDSNFIYRLSNDFEQKFCLPLPHPKVDSVVDRVAALAFGTDSEKGGHKHLIFTRRVSTVYALRDRLVIRYLQAVEARMLRCWDVKSPWTGNSDHLEEDIDTEDPEGFEYEHGENPFREAIDELDPDSMSPREALDALYQLKKLND